MAENVTREILHFDIEQGDAISQQEKLKAALINLKLEAKQLQDAYKAGSITLQEFANETVRVENVQKKTLDTYKQVQTQVTGVKNAFDKLGDSMQEGAKDLNIAGVSVGGLGAKIIALANPVTAAIAAIGFLGKAYSDSAVGAIDLREATDDLKATYDLLANDVGNSTKGGFFSTLAENVTNTILLIKNLDASEIRKKHQAEVDLAILRDLEVEQIKLDKENADRKDKAYKDQLIRDAKEGVSLEEKRAAGERIAKELQERTTKQNELDEKKIKANQQYGIDTNQINEKTLKAYDQEGALNIKILGLQKNISETRAENGRLIDRAILKTQSLTEAIHKQAEAEDKVFEKGRFKPIKPGGGATTTGTEDEIAQLQKDEGAKHDIVVTFEEQRNAYLKLKGEQEVEDNKKKNDKIADQETGLYNERSKADQSYSDTKKALLYSELQLIDQTLIASSHLFKQGTAAQKTLAVAEALIHTYSAAAKAFDTAGGGYSGAAYAAITVALGLAEVAKIEGVTFSEGGYTGPGAKNQPAGIVHAGEVVWNQRDVAMAGGPQVVNAMRPTYSYANGGIVANASTAQIDIHLASLNSFKNLPPMVVGVKEYTRVSDRVTAKEKATTI